MTLLTWAENRERRDLGRGVKEEKEDKEMSVNDGKKRQGKLRREGKTHVLREY